MHKLIEDLSFYNIKMEIREFSSETYNITPIMVVTFTHRLYEETYTIDDKNSVKEMSTDYFIHVIETFLNRFIDRLNHTRTTKDKIEL